MAEGSGSIQPDAAVIRGTGGAIRDTLIRGSVGSNAIVLRGIVRETQTTVTLRRREDRQAQ